MFFVVSISLCLLLLDTEGFPGGSVVMPMQETRVKALGQIDPLEKELATHSSFLAWRIPWAEEPGGLQSTGRKESDTTE